MASRTRPFVMTGAALVSAAAIVAATPALTPALMAGGSAPTPPALTTAAVELTALSDINLQDATYYYFNGYDSYVGSGWYQGSDGFTCENEGGTCDPYFLEFPTGTPLPVGSDGYVVPNYVAGLSGVLYYVLDAATDYSSWPLSYAFEVSPGAAVYTALLGAAGGSSTPAGALIKAVYFAPYYAGQAVVAAASLLPQVSLGPVTIGGGILANLYFNQGGIPAIISYITESIVNALPGSTVSSASATAAKEVTAASATEEVKASDTEAPATTDATDTTDTTDTTDVAPATKKTSVRAKLVDEVSSYAKGLLDAPAATVTTGSDTTDTTTPKTEETTSDSTTPSSTDTTTETPKSTTSDTGSSDTKSAPKQKRENKRAKASASSSKSDS